MLLDETEVAVLVEDLWRTMLRATERGEGEGATALVNRFQKRLEDKAKAMPPGEGQRYVDMVELERERMFQEYNADPEELKERLGVTTARRAPSGNGRMGLSEVAVRTAVRATVWESIYSLFGLFR